MSWWNAADYISVAFHRYPFKQPLNPRFRSWGRFARLYIQWMVVHWITTVGSKREGISLFESTDLCLAQGQAKYHFTLSIIDAFIRSEQAPLKGQGQFPAGASASLRPSMLTHIVPLPSHLRTKITCEIPAGCFSVMEKNSLCDICDLHPFIFLIHCLCELSVKGSVLFDSNSTFH